MTGTGIGTYILYIVGVIIFLMVVLYFVPLGLWFQALVSGVRISLIQLIFMRWRKVPPSVIVRAMIEGTKAGLILNRNDLEAHYLAGGHVEKLYMPWFLLKKQILICHLIWPQRLILQAEMCLKQYRCQ